jgi:hypothetical protein
MTDFTNSQEMFENPTVSLNALCNSCARIAWFWGWINSEVYKIEVDTADKLLARFLGAAGCIKKREDQLRRTTRDLSTPGAKCTEVDGGIFEHLL